MSNPDDGLRGLSALADPIRRALYRFVAAQPAAVSRDEAARATGVTRPVAAFHLDRLAEHGLLETESRRLTGRQGPGAGRPAKLYRRSRREIAVSLPERHYDLAASLLAEAVSPAPRGFAARLAEVSRARGRALGEKTLERLRRKGSRRALVEAVEATLREQGYEPRAEGADVVLGNCPFHALAENHRDLVCGMNHELLSGFAGALPEGAVTARLEPVEGLCCVRLKVR
jgi:predicted ArsR family transcriptional regulator